jgi:hypothetical protein
LVLCRSAADFFALSGTLVRKWFSKFEEAASVAVLFVLSAVILIPSMLFLSGLRSESYTNAADWPAITLLLLGTVLAAAAGRVVYQMALTATNNENGFVSMFLLLVPAVTCLVSIPTSWWISELNIAVGPTFFLGLFLIAAPLFAFSLQSLRSASARPGCRGVRDWTVLPNNPSLNMRLHQKGYENLSNCLCSWKSA